MPSPSVAIVGASGYSGEELLRLLTHHPIAGLVCLTSRGEVGRKVADVYPKLTGTRYGSLRFSRSDPEFVLESGASIAFLALPHGLAHEYALPLLEAGIRVIDLSADFRLKDALKYEEFYGHSHPAPALLRKSVYGMPEIYRELIRDAQLVASPGCYPTSIILPLMPLLKNGLLEANSIVVSSMSGVSGAGRKADIVYSFVECNESVRAYGVPKHRHLSEIEQELSVAAGYEVRISFSPHLIPVSRGIYTTIHAKLCGGVTLDLINASMVSSYGGERFVRMLGSSALPDIKNVTMTNFLDIAWCKDSRMESIVVMSAEDNLVKGAAGQAIQCLNLMNGWDEAAGLCY